MTIGEAWQISVSGKIGKNRPVGGAPREIPGEELKGGKGIQVLEEIERVSTCISMKGRGREDIFQR